MLRQHKVIVLTGTGAVGYDIGDYIIDSAGEATITLPTQMLGVWYRFVNVGIGDAIVDGTTLTTGETVYIVSDGTAWRQSTGGGGGGAGTVTEVTGSGAISVADGTSTPAITHLSTSGYKHIPSGGSSGKFIGWASDGTGAWDDPPAGIDAEIELDIIVNGGDGEIAAALAEIVDGST